MDFSLIFLISFLILRPFLPLVIDLLFVDLELVDLLLLLLLLDLSASLLDFTLFILMLIDPKSVPLDI